MTKKKKAKKKMKTFPRIKKGERDVMVSITQCGKPVNEFIARVSKKTDILGLVNDFLKDGDGNTQVEMRFLNVSIAGIEK